MVLERCTATCVLYISLIFYRKLLLWLGKLYLAGLKITLGSSRVFNYIYVLAIKVRVMEGVPEILLYQFCTCQNLYSSSGVKVITCKCNANHGCFIVPFFYSAINSHSFSRFVSYMQNFQDR